MTIPFLIGIAILVVCGAAGLALVFYLAKLQDRRSEHFYATLKTCPELWSSIILDPKFNSREFLRKSYRFGDLAIYMVPEGILLNDGGKVHWIGIKEGDSPLISLATKRHSMDFMAMYKNYLWIQGGKGKFQLQGSLSKGLDFRPLAEKWGWDIYDGIPEGTELPKRFKG